MTVHDNIISDNAIKQEPPSPRSPDAENSDNVIKEEHPPPQPPSPQNYDMTTLSHDKEVIDKWNDKIGQHKSYAKTRSSRTLWTESQLREDVEVVRLITRGPVNMRLKYDGGTNISVTNDITILYHAQDITDHFISGICKGIKTTKKGILYLQCKNGDVIPVRMYYLAKASEALVSPTSTVTSHFDKFDSWSQTNNVRHGTGALRLFSASGLQSIHVDLEIKNKLWYVNQPVHSSIHHTAIVNVNTSIHNAIISRTKVYNDYEVWHHHLGHHSESSMKSIAKFTTDAPPLHRKYPYFKCPCWQDSKMIQMLKGYATDAHRLSTGNIFQIHFGFIRGPDDDTTTKENIVSSFDGYTSYLLVVDKSSRYTWVFLTEDKSPPITIVNSFLEQQGLKEGVRRVRID